MKVNEITEGIFSNLARDFVGGTNAQATDLRRREQEFKYRTQQADASTPAPLNPLARTNPARTAPAPEKVKPAEVSKFLQQFEIIDDSPVTIQWKNQQFQRKGETGEWVTFPGGKPAPEQMSAALDKVSPLPKAPAKPPKPIAVKDNAGVVWTKDETTKTWKSTSGVVATPVNAKELEKRALPQYQARQMGV